MVGADADVFVHVEPDDARPVDARLGDERVEELELRVAGREHRVRAATRRDGVARAPPPPAGPPPRRGCAHRARVGRAAVRRRRRVCSRPRAADANCGSQRLVASSSSSVIAASRSKSMRPASGSSSMASTTLSRLPVTAASTVSSCDAETRWRVSAIAGGSATWSRPRTPSPSATHMPSTTTSGGRSATWPAVRDVEREPPGPVELEAGDQRRHHLARRPLRHRRAVEHLLELADVVRLPQLALLDRREVHAPPVAPTRLLGEEAREELDDVPVAGARQHAEAREQLQLHLVLSHEVGLVGIAVVEHLAESVETVGAGDVERGDERQVVHAGDRGGDLEEVGVEQLAERELHAGDLVAEPHRLHRGLPGDGAADRGHRVGEVEQPRVGTHRFHVARELEEHRDVPQRAVDPAGPDAVADRLHHAVAGGHREVVAHRREAAGRDVHDHVVGALERAGAGRSCWSRSCRCRARPRCARRAPPCAATAPDRRPRARSRRRGAAACSRSRRAASEPTGSCRRR